MTAPAATAALQTRFDHVLGRLRLVEASVPASVRPRVHEVWEELVAIRRDLEPRWEVFKRPRPAASIHNLARANASRHATKEHDGQRNCPRHDDGAGAWLPVESFSVKNKATGALRSWCDECYRAYLRERYVRTTATAVTVELHEDDFCVGHPCPVCRKAFAAGQRVVGKELAHEGCRLTQT
jgi:hypothetical protein